jgi:V8-like Glu-specific endopeptidase
LDTRLADVAEKFSSAVGIVVVSGFDKGTAWAVGPNRFATNAHVIVGIKESLDEFKKIGRSASVFIAINSKKDVIYRVKKMQINSLYGKREVNYEGTESLGKYDTGFLFTKRETPVFFKLANIQTLKALRAGTKIGYLGFPTESLRGDNVNLSNPIATMQTGVITSMSNYFMEAKEPKYFVRHNLPAHGGASGSPLFTSDGEVVAILRGANMYWDQGCVDLAVIQEKDPSELCPRRVNAALVNFAERADLLYVDKWKWKTISLD